MNSDFPDELLSGLLDDELSPAERQRVEQHLASHPADRQLLEELRALRDDLQRLPPVAVPPDFAQRVVQAALAAQPPTPASPAAAGSRAHLARGAMFAMSLAGVAAAFLVGLWLAGRFALAPRQRDSAGSPLAGTVGSSPTDARPVPGKSDESSAPRADAAEALRHALAATGSGQALVVRLRVGKDFPTGVRLDAALTEAGLVLRPPSDVSTGASALAPAWRQRVQERLQSAGSTHAAAAAALAAPSDALWIEGSAEDIQTLVRRLSRQSPTAVVVPEARLAVGSRAADIAEGEGEPGPLRGKTSTEVQASGPLAQRLPPTLFPLPREPVSGELESPSEQAGGRRRVLLLIERVD